jgi:hypothetical protein
MPLTATNVTATNATITTITNRHHHRTGTSVKLDGRKGVQHASLETFCRREKAG